VRMRNRKLRNMRSNITYPKTTNVCKNCNYWRCSPLKMVEKGADNQWKG
jgi:hypothetical protein